MKWNITGPQGLQGPQGDPGPKGDTGAKGDTGSPGAPGVVGSVVYAEHHCTNNADNSQTSCAVQCPTAGQVAVGGGGYGAGSLTDRQDLNGSLPITSTNANANSAGDKPTGWRVYVDNQTGGTGTDVYVFVTCIDASTTGMTIVP